MFRVLLFVIGLSVNKEICQASVIKIGEREAPRIAHGRPAVRGPYQVQVLSKLENNTAKICSGAIINHWWILTTAQCIEKEPIEILTGVLNLHRKKSGHFFKAVNRIRHPEYSRRGGIIHHDIGLIKVDKKIHFDSHNVKAIELKEMIAVHRGLILRVAGWGKTEHKSSSSRIVETVMKVENNTVCQIEGFEELTENHICASTLLQGSADCQGDCGGPVTDINRKHLVGLVSFRFDDKCPSHFPSVYIKVAPYVPWIMQMVHDDQSHH